jgi:hypothetical protein
LSEGSKASPSPVGIDPVKDANRGRPNIGTIISKIIKVSVFFRDASDPMGIISQFRNIGTAIAGAPKGSRGLGKIIKKRNRVGDLPLGKKAAQNKDAEGGLSHSKTFFSGFTIREVFCGERNSEFTKPCLYKI